MYKMQGMGKGAVAVLVASMVLAACGGGDDGDSSSSSTSTATAAASSSSSSSSVASNTSSSSSSGTTASGTTVTWTPSQTSLASYLAACASGNYPFNATSSEITVDGLNFYSGSAGSLRLYDSSSDCSGSTYAVNYNGTSFATAYATTDWTAGNTVSLTASTGITRYIKVPYSSATTTTPSIKVTVTETNSSCSTGTVVITNASGTVLSASNGTTTGTGNACVSSTQTVVSASDTATLGASGAFYVLFTRGSVDTSGGLRVWKIEYTY